MSCDFARKSHAPSINMNQFIANRPNERGVEMPHTQSDILTGKAITGDRIDHFHFSNCLLIFSFQFRYASQQR